MTFRQCGRPTLRGSRWTWSSSGKFRRYVSSSNHGRYVWDDLMTYDGRYVYRFKGPHGNPPVNLEHISRGRFFGTPRQTACPLELVHNLNGMVEHNHQSLVDLLSGGNTGPARVEWSGNPGTPILTITRPRIIFPRMEEARKAAKPRSDTETIRITLDPRHGYLPRIVERETQQVVIEFRYVKDPGVWFPARGYATTTSAAKGGRRRSWQITDVKINTDLDESVFNPGIPEGTRIMQGEGYIEYVDLEKQARKLAERRRRHWWLA